MQHYGIRFLKKHYIRVLSVFLLLNFFVGTARAEGSITPAAANVAADKEATQSELQFYSKKYGYYDYMRDTSDIPAPIHEYVLPGKDYISSNGAEVSVADNEKGEADAVFWSNQMGEITYKVNVAQKGKYKIKIGYLPTPNHTGNMEFEVYINGKILFDEASRISMQRMWKDEGPIKQDNRDNDLRPAQVDHSQWMHEDIRDRDGLYSDGFQFVLDEGENHITFRMIRETITISYIKIYNELPDISYLDYQKQNFNKYPKGYSKFFEAEKAVYKSSPSLYPVSDRISPLTRPYSASKIRLNTIGGKNYRYPGQWIEWTIDVPEDGDYMIAMRTRQDQLRGLYSHRRIYIDGKVPFHELNEIRYPYDANWKTQALGENGKPYVFHLTEGQHTIKMEVIIGSMGATIDAIEDSIFDLNAMYRKIIMITGVTPDIYRDYDIEKEIPELKTEFLRIAKLFDDELARIEKSIGKSSSEAALLKEMSVQLRSLAQYPRTITERLDRYKSNISSLSSWLLEIKQQPLEIDYLWVASPGMTLPRSSENFFEKLIHEIRTFAFSFFENYDLIGNVKEDTRTLTVWVGSGRDQAQIIKSMIDDQFTPKYNVNVNVSLVQGTLLEATMAGKGPNIALNVARYLPVDLAVRGALLNMDKFSEFHDIKSDFQSTAFIPYTLNGKIYAMPETQEFNMLFYRKDIFAELNIDPPETWEELYTIIPVIERKNMDVGIPSLIQQAAGDTYMPFPRTFGTMLIQKGLDYYVGDMSKTTFDRKEAIETYKEFIDLYREYSLPVYFDFANRFRTGEMPIGIAPYSTYNFLYIFAPEISNLWGMTMIPGTKMEDGSIHRGEEGYGSGCVIFNNVENEQDAFDFVKWWTSEEAQVRYGREMESLMGPAARQPTANIKAFEKLPWSAMESKVLKEQWMSVKEQPEIPGSYFVSRNLNNAIIETLYENGNALATLEKYNKYINEEITRKRIEFGLNGGETND